MTIIHKNELFLKSHFPLPQITKNRSQNKKKTEKRANFVKTLTFSKRELMNKLKIGYLQQHNVADATD
uniref:hypothetical protein n=1 Tax=Prevotella sp. TaxID=59823 RepID=UPI003FEF2EFC